jgi:hypothetical protein
MRALSGQGWPSVEKGRDQIIRCGDIQNVIYEGVAPHQVVVMLECLTDKLRRSVPAMRVLLRQGPLGTSGLVAWDFECFSMIGLLRRIWSPATRKVRACSTPTELDLRGNALGTQGFKVLDRAKLEALSCECYEVVKKETDLLLPYLPQRQLIKDADSIPVVKL